MVWSTEAESLSGQAASLSHEGERNFGRAGRPRPPFLFFSYDSVPNDSVALFSVSVSLGLNLFSFPAAEPANLFASPVRVMLSAG